MVQWGRQKTVAKVYIFESVPKFEIGLTGAISALC